MWQGSSQKSKLTASGQQPQWDGGECHAGCLCLETSAEIESVHLQSCLFRIATLRVCGEGKTRASCMFVQLEDLEYLATKAIISFTFKSA